jgi:hypothetical protein
MKQYLSRGAVIDGTGGAPLAGGYVVKVGLIVAVAQQPRAEADLIKIMTSSGSGATGKVADVVLINGDPLADSDAIGRVRAV